MTWGTACEEPIRKGAKKFVTHFWTTHNHVTRADAFALGGVAWVTGVINAHARDLCKKGTKSLPPSSICAWTLFHAPKWFPNCKQVEIKLSPMLNLYFPSNTEFLPGSIFKALNLSTKNHPAWLIKIWCMSGCHLPGWRLKGVVGTCVEWQWFSSILSIWNGEDFRFKVLTEFEYREPSLVD